MCTRADPPAACSASASTASFSPLPHPSSTIVDGSGAERRHDFFRVRDQQSMFCARDSIPRQSADRLEQARPERVVQILRLKLLRRELQIAAHFGGEFERKGLYVMTLIDDSSAGSKDPDRAMPRIADRNSISPS